MWRFSGTSATMLFLGALLVAQTPGGAPGEPLPGITPVEFEEWGAARHQRSLGISVAASEPAFLWVFDNRRSAPGASPYRDP